MDAYNISELGRCLSCIIRDKGLCNAMTAEQLMQFKQIARRRVYKSGDVILSGEDSVTFIAGVVTGIVKISKILSDGRQQIIGLLFPADSLGRAYGKNNPYFAEAATDVELCCFEKSGFEGMMEDFSGLKQRLLEQTLDDLDAARDWMTLLGRKTAEEKVASFFLLLARRSPPTGQCGNGFPPPDIFDLHLKRSEIGDYLGLTYETVCRQIKSLTDQGVLEWVSKRRFRVRDAVMLTEMAK